MSRVVALLACLLASTSALEDVALLQVKPSKAKVGAAGAYALVQGSAKVAMPKWWDSDPPGVLHEIIEVGLLVKSVGEWIKEHGGSRVGGAIASGVTRAGMDIISIGSYPPPEETHARTQLEVALGDLNKDIQRLHSTGPLSWMDPRLEEEVVGLERSSHQLEMLMAHTWHNQMEKNQDEIKMPSWIP